MRHGIGDQHFVDDQILRISAETGIKVVATNDTHYLEQKMPMLMKLLCVLL